MYGGEPVFFLLDRMENGMFTAKLPQGEYHMEAFAYILKQIHPTNQSWQAEMNHPQCLPSMGILLYTQELISLLEEEYRMSHEMAQTKGTVAINGDVEIDHIFFDFFPVPPKRRGW